MAVPTPASQYVQATSLAAVKIFGLSVANGAATAPDFEVPANATKALLQAETQNVRFRCDGTSPTTTVGTLLTAGGVPVVIEDPQAIRLLRAIEVSASAKLNVQFLAAE